MSHTHWKILPKPGQLPDISGVHPLVVQLLYNRGITEPEDIEIFLANDERLEVDPNVIPDMAQAVLRTHQALLSGEKIAIYGDFDADGITATALLVEGLSALGATAIPYIPNRTSEGYGLRAPALEKLRDQGVSLVITVDTGVTAVAEVEIARKMKMDVIITDHHVPVGQLPNARAVVNPKRSDSRHPLKDLAGVGVAYKFLQALVTDRAKEHVLTDVLDLVAIGTVTDMVTLQGENRYWVKKGLKLINEARRLGVKEILRTARLTPGELEAQAISWGIGPRINAAGRVDNATTSYKLLLIEDPLEAKELAEELERKNAERLQRQNELLLKAIEQINSSGAEKLILFAGDQDYHAGVLGPVAGRLTDKYYRPVILFRIGKESCRGSGRSIAEFDLISALTECQDLLTKFGGHTRAAGMNLATSDLPEFRRRIYEIATEKLEGLDLRPHINIDAVIPLASLDFNLYDQIQKLAPFGMGNPDPVFLTRQVAINNLKQMGSNSEHIRCRVKQGDAILNAVGWDFSKYLEELPKYIDIVYKLEMNNWNGQQSLRLNLQDFSPA
jgi:single-stranded-DNA-specific exonuclease